MNHFDYRNGVLHAEAVNLSELADAVGTPFYCYSTATLERHYRVFAEAFAGEKTLVCYAMKANSNQAVIATLAKLGAVNAAVPMKVKSWLPATVSFAIGTLLLGAIVVLSGKAGGIGSVAIRLAKSIGAYVATTATAEDRAYVQELGADEVIE